MTEERPVDLSSDVGERPGPDGLADDFALLELITSANVACGGHAGDRVSMRTICEVAVARGVVLGAQVSYVDREGFGRRRLQIPRGTLAEQLREQWGELADAATAGGGHVAYMRPHGALYNTALVDADVAAAVLDATPAATPILCLAGTALAVLAAERGHPVAHEIFADRAVTDDGLLVPRGTPGAVIDDPEIVAERLAAWLRTGHLTSQTGRPVPVAARSICVHSDTPGAVRAAAKVRAALLAAGARLSPFAPGTSTARATPPPARATPPPVPGFTARSAPGARRPIAAVAAETVRSYPLTALASDAIRLTVHPFGERAVLVDVAGISPADLAPLARRMFGPDLIDAVPTADCVLLTFATPANPTHVGTLLRHGQPAAAQHVADDAPGLAAPAAVTIGVHYDGADLADVARSLGVSVDQVIALHSRATFRVAFFGFAPGFAYLTGLPPRLHLPRRPTPRTAVPAGAIAIAATYTAVYPRASPGGWHLIGHTDAVMFDPQRTPPTLLTPGATVRFRPT